jgi:hypothetical protein
MNTPTTSETVFAFMVYELTEFYGLMTPSEAAFESMATTLWNEYGAEPVWESKWNDSWPFQGDWEDFGCEFDGKLL